MGRNFETKADHPRALDAFFKSIRIFEEQGQKKSIGLLSNAIGVVYARLNENDKSLEYLFKSLKIAEEVGDQGTVMSAFGNIGATYAQMGKYDDAIKYLNKALYEGEKVGDKSNQSLNLGNIGNIYVFQKQYSPALKYEFAALRISKEINNKINEVINTGNIGEIFYLIAADSLEPKQDSLVLFGRKANLSNGISYLEEALWICREINFIGPIPEFAEYLSKALVLQGDFKGALAAFKESTRVKDSLFNIANTEMISNLETKRAVELKDKDIEIQKLHLKNKRSERVFYISGIGLLLVILGILLNGYRRKQKSNHLLAKEKKRSDDLLLNILPSEVAEELKENGTAAAQYFENVSVLYTDFVNFTQIGEALSPKVLVKELHECFSAFDAIVERHGLEKIKTVGDAYIAVCGVPAADPRHAQKCVAAALEILEFMDARKKQERVFEIRIGINSGPLVAGIVGTKKFAYDIWGDTVNTAARMEQHGEPGRINVSQSTFELVKDEFSCNPRGRITAKHKGEVEMYFVQLNPVAAEGGRK
jgi:class 3 adenylate cyclase